MIDCQKCLDENNSDKNLGCRPPNREFCPNLRKCKDQAIRCVDCQFWIEPEIRPKVKSSSPDNPRHPTRMQQVDKFNPGRVNPRNR